ncbi:MAG: CinA family protein [Gammaproteobacteria bacterium]|nr:CinA family protein [Gammaproteobacteria bacterium]
MLDQLALEVGNHLKKHSLILTTAESCTGGGVAYHITDIPGSSTWFDRGFVTYSNSAKIQMLSVPSSTLDTYGAVSEETARAMAEGALQHSNADVSVAITGIAGPDGGTTDKPVGTVWFAWAYKNKPTLAVLKNFSGNREEIRKKSIEVALRGILEIPGAK